MSIDNVNQSPVETGNPEPLDELVCISGLLDVTVRAAPIAALEDFWIIGSAKHDHGHVTYSMVRTDSLKNIQAATFAETDLNEGYVRYLYRISVEKKAGSLIPISRNLDLREQLG